MVQGGRMLVSRVNPNLANAFDLDFISTEERPIFRRFLDFCMEAT